MSLKSTIVSPRIQTKTTHQIIIVQTTTETAYQKGYFRTVCDSMCDYFAVEIFHI